MVSFSGKITKFWSSQKARVLDSTFKVKIGPMGLKNVKTYVKEQGYPFENHIVFQMDNGVYVWFTNNQILIGSKIEEGD